MIVVCDTSPITNLAAVDHLWLLQKLYRQIIIPEAVFNELIDARFAVPGSDEVKAYGWIQTRAVQNQQLVASLLTKLDPGEAEAIALAVELRANLLVLDERKGYAAASNLNVRVLGVLGVLLAAKKRGLIEQVKPLVDALIGQAGFWVSKGVYRQVLTMAGEQQ